MEYVRSRQRVVDHGEVFTPAWMVNDMLDLVKSETERIESRFLEPACGSGNFLVPVLERKLSTVKAKYRSSEFELRHFALAALMSIYGIELLANNVEECRDNLLAVFGSFLRTDGADGILRAASVVLGLNIVNGDALTMLNSSGRPIMFAEWAYLGKGRFQRRDFRFDALTQMSLYGEGTLFEGMNKAEIFRAEKDDYPSLSISEIASTGPSSARGKDEVA